MVIHDMLTRSNENQIPVVGNNNNMISGSLVSLVASAYSEIVRMELDD